MKFRYYRVSLFDGNVKGTNDEAKAREWMDSEEDFIIDSETGLWLHNFDDPSMQDIKEF